MPISRKTGAPYFTEEQLNYAKYETSTLEYVKQQGYPLKKKGAYYTHSDHSSLVFAPNGSWHWNSRSMHGNAIDFITQVEQKPESYLAYILFHQEKGLLQRSNPLLKARLRNKMILSYTKDCSAK